MVYMENGHLGKLYKWDQLPIDRDWERQFISEK